jgi:hypothetical protein
VAARAGTRHATAAFMSHRHVETVIGRLATDPQLRRRFENSPVALLHELVAQGYELSSIEVDALASIERASMRAFAGALDARLRRIDHHNDTRQSHD